MIRGKTRLMDKPKSEYDIGAKIHNRFDVEVIDALTGEVRQTCRGYNVICNQLWNNWFLQVAWNSYIFYGSGEGTPSASDTALFSRIGYAASSIHSVESNSEEHWVSYTKKIQLSETTAVGQKITEVGIGYGSTETDLCTHAMLQDMNGNTISIEKTDTDIINIYATVFVHWTPTSAVKIFGHWKDSPADAGLGAFAGLLPFAMGYKYNVKSNYPYVTKGILSQNLKSTTHSGYLESSVSIDSGNKKATVSHNRMGVSDYNISGLHHVVWYYNVGTDDNLVKPWLAIELPSDQVPAVPIVGEAVGTGDGSTTEFITKFPYAGDAVVYVDGVVATGVTVNPNTFAPDYTVNDYFEEVWESESGGNTGWGYLSTVGFPSDKVNQNTMGVVGDHYIFYNPNYGIGLAQFRVYNGDIYASNDLINWEEVFVGQERIDNAVVPDKFIHYRYWKAIPTKSSFSTRNFNNAKPPSTYNSNNIIFETAPAEGSVITIDYTPQCIPKDENHVFDLSITFHFGEYTET